MKKTIIGVSAALCFALASSCVTGRYVVSYGNFAPLYFVEWDWEHDPPVFAVQLKANAEYANLANPEKYEFTVTASSGEVIPSEKIYNAGGSPEFKMVGSYWMRVENVYVRLKEMPPDTDFPIKLRISMGGKVIETFNVKLR
jgi:hypothetical protein